MEKYRYTEGEFNLFPKTKTIRKMTLFETNNRFVLVGGDKTVRQLHVITFKKLDVGRDGVVVRTPDGGKEIRDMRQHTVRLTIY